MKTVRARLMAAAVATVAAVAATAAGSAAIAGNETDSRGGNVLSERLNGYQEDPNALSTTGSGTVRLHINERAQTITYRLSYQQLEGDVAVAHVHLGRASQSGGVIFFFCSNGTAPPGTQACPPAPATVTGTITPANIVGPAAAGIAPGEFAEAVAALRSGTTYANVHSSKYPGGEIRGNLDHHHHHHH